MRPVILVGIRYGQEERDRNWAFNRARWEQLGWPIFEGVYDEPGPFSMAVASNRAAALATRDYAWDVALYVGADFAAKHLSQAEQAAAGAATTGKLTFAHTHLTLLEPEETDELVAAGAVEPTSTRHPNTFSGVLAVTRALWEQVGGFDERFQGWGYEDLAFWASCCALGGGFDRVPGDIYHLWHPRTRAENEDGPHHPANQVLGERYLAAKGNAQAMRAILSESDR